MAEARRLLILGVTGSIGRSTIDVVEHLRGVEGAAIEVVGVSAHRDEAGLLAAAARIGASVTALSGADSSQSTYSGPDALLELIDHHARPGDLVLTAVVGAAGLPVTLAAIERGCDIALANKETLVAGGALVVPLARERGVRLLPVDSEHSALAQALRAGRGIDEVSRMVLTASGGPFRSWPRERIMKATVAEALAHPTWSMGPKVTVDSASLMNKGLELIEAHWLFGLGADQLDAVVHPQSIVHSFVEFVDGSVIAQLSPPDMRMPIQYALTDPDRVEGVAERLDFAALRTLEFEPVDRERFPALDLARRAIDAGGTTGAILNGANEAAVAAFLDGGIAFGEVIPLVTAALDAVPSRPLSSLADCLGDDAAARQFVADRLGTPSLRESHH